MQSLNILGYYLHQMIWMWVGLSRENITTSKNCISKKERTTFNYWQKKKLLSFQLQDGEEDESPYIGKARFKPNKFTRKSNIDGGGQHAEVITMGSRPSERYREQNKQVQQELHDSLIFDLRDKERAIQQGQWPLHKIFWMSSYWRSFLIVYL